MNAFDQYRDAKRYYGGRVKKNIDWKGWAIPGFLLVIAAITWIFAVPGYMTLGESEAGQVERADRSEMGHRVLPGLLLTERQPHELAIVFLDIGQGDAIFIQSPEQRTMLVDTGEGTNPDYEFARQTDAANKVILPFLASNGIERLNYLIGTHPHSDHIGAARDVLNSMPVDEVWIPGADHPSTSKKDILAAIEETGVPLKVSDEIGGTLRLGQEIDMGAGVKAWLAYIDPHATSDINNSSIVILIRYGERSIMLTGDVHDEAEIKLMELWGDQLDVDVLKAAHHGSRTSSSQPFIDFIRPKHTVFQVGSYNTFGHPTDEVVSRVKEAGSEIHRTDEDGTIFMFIDGENIRILNRRDIGIPR